MLKLENIPGWTGQHLPSMLLLSWWRHQMETFSVLLDFCVRNSPVTSEFPSQRPVMQSFNVFFDLRLNKRLSKQSWGWWFEMPLRSLWCHCNDQPWYLLNVHDEQVLVFYQYGFQIAVPFECPEIIENTYKKLSTVRIKCSFYSRTNELEDNKERHLAGKFYVFFRKSYQNSKSINFAAKTQSKLQESQDLWAYLAKFSGNQLDPQ